MGNSIYLGGGIKSAFCGGNVKEIWQGTDKLFPSIIGNLPFVLDASKFDLTTLKQGDVQFLSHRGSDCWWGIDNNCIIARGNWPSLPLNNFESETKNLHFKIELSIDKATSCMWYVSSRFGGVMGSVNNLYGHPALSIQINRFDAKRISPAAGQSNYFSWGQGWAGYGDIRGIDTAKKFTTDIYYSGKVSKIFVNGVKYMEVEFNQDILDYTSTPELGDMVGIIFSTDRGKSCVRLHSLEVDTKTTDD